MQAGGAMLYYRRGSLLATFGARSATTATLAAYDRIDVLRLVGH